jgi:DNA polymerase-3 subunit epsilon
LIKNIPNQPGVYIFYDADGTVLYVGKSTHLKDRVMSHFSAFHSISTDLKLLSQAADLEFIRTGGDLSACLLEAELIKKMQPVFNRQLREARESVAVIKNEKSRYHTIELKRIKLPLDADFGKIVTIYPSMKKAKEVINEIIKEKHICPIASGLENGKGPCFNFQIGKCDGACIGKESALKHNLKLIVALGNYFIPKWPFDGEITVKEESDDVTELVHINNWMHIGTTSVKGGDFRFTQKESAIYTDTVKILKRFLKRGDFMKKIVKKKTAQLLEASIY